MEKTRFDFPKDTSISHDVYLPKHVRIAKQIISGLESQPEVGNHLVLEADRLVDTRPLVAKFLYNEAVKHLSGDEKEFAKQKSRWIQLHKLPVQTEHNFETSVKVDVHDKSFDDVITELHVRPSEGFARDQEKKLRHVKFDPFTETKYIPSSGEFRRHSFTHDSRVNTSVLSTRRDKYLDSAKTYHYGFPSRMLHEQRERSNSVPHDLKYMLPLSSDRKREKRHSYPLHQGICPPFSHKKPSLRHRVATVAKETIGVGLLLSAGLIFIPPALLWLVYDQLKHGKNRLDYGGYGACTAIEFPGSVLPGLPLMNESSIHNQEVMSTSGYSRIVKAEDIPIDAGGEEYDLSITALELRLEEKYEPYLVQKLGELLASHPSRYIEGLSILRNFSMDFHKVYKKIKRIFKYYDDLIGALQVEQNVFLDESNLHEEDCKTLLQEIKKHLKLAGYTFDRDGKGSTIQLVVFDPPFDQRKISEQIDEKEDIVGLAIQDENGLEDDIPFDCLTIPENTQCHEFMVSMLKLMTQLSSQVDPSLPYLFEEKVMDILEEEISSD